MINKHSLAACALLLVFGAFAQAQTFTTLYNFTGSSDGAYPYAGLIEGKVGTLYGTTLYGGSAPSLGVVFGVSARGETVLHAFTGKDGAYPYATLVRDRQNSLYGTTYTGGSSYYDYGTAFKIDSTGTETILYNFTGGTTDGCYPSQGLTMDNAGNFYGATTECGASGYGTIFTLTTAGAETILHSFAGGTSDGQYPWYAPPLLDKAGNLYGVTEYGGPSDNGVVYKLSKNGTLTLLHSFAGGTSDGCIPFGAITMDTKGNLYGTTAACGAASYGTIWKLSKKGIETILHSFTGADGAYPYAGVVLDSKGNLYGDTEYGGAKSYYGTVYKLSKSGKLTLLHSFSNPDGAHPWGPVFRDAKGRLYGTTLEGGSSGDGCGGYGCGTVWEYVP